MTNNKHRYIVTNNQVSSIFHRFFGLGEKYLAKSVSISGCNIEQLQSIPVMEELDIVHNQSTNEFYVTNLQGVLSGVPDASVMYVDCKNHSIRLFDKHYQNIVYLGVTIEHIHNLVQALELELA